MPVNVSLKVHEVFQWVLPEVRGEGQGRARGRRRRTEGGDDIKEISWCAYQPDPYTLCPPITVECINSSLFRGALDALSKIQQQKSIAEGGGQRLLPSVDNADMHGIIKLGI